MNDVFVSLIEEEVLYCTGMTCDGGEDGSGGCDCDSDGGGYQ